MIGVRALIGGGRPRPEEAVPRVGRDVHHRVSAKLAHLRRLEEDLERARLRYERAIANYERRADELERGIPVSASDRKSTGRSTSRRPGGVRLKLSKATLDDLRALGLSLTQGKRVLRHRSEGDVDSVADLKRVPGIPRAKLAELQQQLSD